MTTFLSSIASLSTDSPSADPSRVDRAFPVVYSTLSPSALADLVLSRYPIDLPKNCQFWHRGLSDVYLLETLTTSYILRVSHCHWRGKSEIDFELELLDFLDRWRVPVAAPIRTRDGELSVEITAPEGERYAVLFPLAPGQVAIGDFTPDQARKLGSIVARIHQVSRNFQTLAHRHPLDSKYLLRDSLQTIAPFLHQRPADLQFLVETIAEIETVMARLPASAPYWNVCWGDPHSGNVHITADNQMTLFDFDQCGYGWRVFDLAKFLQVSLQSGVHRQVRQAFIEGYDEIAKLSPIERSSLQSLTQAAYIWSWAIHLNNTKLTDYSRLDGGYFTARLSTLKRLRTREWELF
ncbi:phosphotransferase [Pannus brasiliensis CCIBt3594]|uniref:Phosphotransferase n=1 Tax=Pannus brasiliensis CCIBt3594 TaxID=1427578 RepID=A0AAW9QUI2_9CHRO